MRQLVILALLLAGARVDGAGAAYVHTGDVGKVTPQHPSAKQDPLSCRTPEQWVGERFLFLPQRRCDQARAYSDFSISSTASQEPTPPALYERLAGKVGKVTKVSKVDTDEQVAADLPPEQLRELTAVHKGDLGEEGQDEYRISLTMEDNGQVVTGRFFGFIGNLPGIAPVADIDEARKRWLGKTLRPIEGKLWTYDQATDEFDPVEIGDKAVKVTDIVAGWDSDCPVRFLLRTPAGVEGYIDVNLSGTNTNEAFREANRFDRLFMTQDAAPNVTRPTHTIQSDLEKARKRWLGKTFWYCSGSLQFYNARTGHNDHLSIKRYSPVKVVKIAGRPDTDAPIRLILRTPAGIEGFDDVSLEPLDFKIKFRDRDPRKDGEGRKWSKKVWSAIERGEPIVGMTADQVGMCLDALPDRINRTTTASGEEEQWVYDHGPDGENQLYLYMVNGVLSAIQTSAPF